VDLPVAPGAAGATRTERPVDSAVHTAANPRPASPQRALLLSVVEETLDAMEPMVVRIVNDEAISAEHAMHIVVMDPTCDSHVAFDEAILLERSFGDRAQWKADYAWYAREKTRVSWRERRSLRTLLAQCPGRLRADDIRVEGAVRDGAWIIGASGAQPWYDHAIASIAVHLLDAAIAQANVAAGSESRAS
jgi:hypothetical protein